MTSALPPCVQRYIAALCAEDLDATLAEFHPDGSFQDPTGYWHGVDQLRQFFTTAYAMVENIKWDVGRTMVEGNKLAFEWNFGYRVVLGPAAGKSAKWDGLTVMELKDNKIWRYRDYWDSLDPLRQLGFKSWQEITAGLI
jgi:ketosteroid isomerase-like protein